MKATEGPLDLAADPPQTEEKMISMIAVPSAPGEIDMKTIAGRGSHSATMALAGAPEEQTMTLMSMTEDRDCVQSPRNAPAQSEGQIKRIGCKDTLTTTMSTITNMKRSRFQGEAALAKQAEAEEILNIHIGDRVEGQEMTTIITTRLHRHNRRQAEDREGTTTV